MTATRFFPPPRPRTVGEAWRRRGWRYVWHKALRRSSSHWPSTVRRRILYRNPREYWTLRGGDDYFKEQEGQPERSARTAWLTERIAAYRPESILEVGCGYGKQLGALRQQLQAPLVGLDFSPTQLEAAGHYLAGAPNISLLLADGQRLPFPDDAFDLVFTSAVLLHHEPETADRIRRELVRVARRWVAHNEDTDITYNRFGDRTADWYRQAGIRLVERGPIPVGSPEAIQRSQFCVAAL